MHQGGSQQFHVRQPCRNPYRIRDYVSVTPREQKSGFRPLLKCGGLTTTSGPAIVLQQTRERKVLPWKSGEGVSIVQAPNANL